MNPQHKATRFRALHRQAGAFVMPNPWDIGSARILASMNFAALATTSSGLAHSLGVRDGTLGRERILQHCRSLVAATDLPLSADLENGYGDNPEDVAETIELAAATGLAGGSIEDYSGRPQDPIYDLNRAVERIGAAVESKRKLPHDFVLTARCENYLWGREDLDDTIMRLQAYAQAGADVLYAPGLRDIETIRTLCESVHKPVNVVIEMPNSNLNFSDLAQAGVKRISIGSVLFLRAYGALIRAAVEMNESGTFEFAADAIDFSVLEKLFAGFKND